MYIKRKKKKIILKKSIPSLSNRNHNFFIGSLGPIAILLFNKTIIIQGGPKKNYDVIQRKSVREILKKILTESSSLYIHIFSKSQSFLSCVDKKLQGSKNPKNCLYLYSQKLKKNKLNFSFFKLTTRKIFDYKEIFFLFYVAKSISFEVISVLKIAFLRPH